MEPEQKKINILFLDFDGTIVDSNKIKDQAFDKIFSRWPQFRDCMMEWHLKHNALDRYKKFEFFVNEILNDSTNESLLNDLVAEFEDMTEKAIINCSYILGAFEFMNELSKYIPIYLLSATPHLNLLNIINKREISNIFNGIYGAPINKREIIQALIFQNKISEDEVLYIGDSQEDLDVATSLKINFILRKSDRKIKENNYPRFNDFNQIKDYYHKKFI